MPDQIAHLEAGPQGGLDLQSQTFTARRLRDLSWPMRTPSGL
jgi:hypothetical protein